MSDDSERNDGIDSITRSAPASIDSETARETEMALRLTWCFGPGGVRRESFPLNKKPIRFGRGGRDEVEEHELKARDPDVSRHHFDLERTAMGWTLRDHSRNGTYVDGQRVPRDRGVTLKSGSVIRAGSCVFVVSTGPRHWHPDGAAPIGDSAAAHGIRARVASVAPLDVPVLLLGETGTGKEYVARAIHDQSGRTDGRFVWINCGALDENLARAEIFGVREGAFTGAVPSDGAIAAAEGGTFFLDEVGNLSLELQAKLLRFLDTKSFRRVGGETATSTARIVAATNEDLEAAVRAGRFREDFLRRLRAAVPPIELPPLRERREDILDWFALYLEREGAELGRGSEFDVTPGFVELLLLHPWPGNLRALHEALGHAILDTVGNKLTHAELPDDVRATRRRARTRTEPVNSVLPAPRSSQPMEITRELIDGALLKFKGNVRQAADWVGLERTKFYRAAKKLGIDPDDYR